MKCSLIFPDPPLPMAHAAPAKACWLSDHHGRLHEDY